MLTGYFKSTHIHTVVTKDDWEDICRQKCEIVELNSKVLVILTKVLVSSQGAD